MKVNFIINQLQEDGVSKDDTKAIREINDFIVSDKRVNISMIPVGDGVTLAVKK